MEMKWHGRELDISQLPEDRVQRVAYITEQLTKAETLMATVTMMTYMMDDEHAYAVLSTHCTRWA